MNPAHIQNVRDFFCLSRMSTSPPSSFATSIKFAGPFLEVWGWPTKVILNCCTVNSTLEWAEIWLKMNKTLYTKLLLQRYATKNCYFCLFFLKGTSEFVLVFTYPFVEIQYLSSHTGIPQRVLKYLLRRWLLARNSTNCKINIGKHVCKLWKG